MQKLKDGYRASFRLNEDNLKHMEIYQMFEELMNSREYQTESDLHREAIISLYRRKTHNNISDERNAEIQECARVTAHEIKGMVQAMIEGAITDLKNSAFSIVSDSTDCSSKSLENIGKKPPESSDELADGLCDFMKELL